MLRVGKYGPYVERGEEKGNVGEDVAPDELDLAMAEALLAAPSGDRVLGRHPESGLEIVARSGRYGPYVTEVLPEDAPKSAKPRTGSLLSGMSLDTITLDDALRIMTLPRVVGTDPEGQEITAANGRYGPYIARTVDGKADYRSLATEDQLFTVTLEEALALYAAPKQRRGQGRVAEPLREIGVDPASGGAITLREGRFGPYVTDGETNASLRKGDEPATITLERAAELLADRRAAGPPVKRTARKPATAAPSAAPTAVETVLTDGRNVRMVPVTPPTSSPPIALAPAQATRPPPPAPEAGAGSIALFWAGAGRAAPWPEPAFIASISRSNLSMSSGWLMAPWWHVRGRGALPPALPSGDPVPDSCTCPQMRPAGSCRTLVPCPPAPS
ncbi:MAG TPA: topoisomerase C-terminal repeat-containing protein [Candidatus Limnocylindrales bacterium]|nr:topoisomerase C-terminal repeat-containing protein [Candidatus Limnocylindrales bacterium]